MCVCSTVQEEVIKTIYKCQFFFMSPSFLSTKLIYITNFSQMSNQEHQVFLGKLCIIMALKH